MTNPPPTDPPPKRHRTPTYRCTRCNHRATPEDHRPGSNGLCIWCIRDDTYGYAPGFTRR